MGACMFHTTGYGKTVREAYNDARDEASFENGHQDGYSGDIQTCHDGYALVDLKPGDDVDDVYEAIGEGDAYNGKYFKKWGKCAAIDNGNGTFDFIGWGAC